MTAREVILERIRAANGVAAGAEIQPRDRPPTYRRRDPRERAAILADFTQKLRDYGVSVRRTEEDGLASEIAAATSSRSVATVVVPADLPESWLPRDVAVQRDGGFDSRWLDAIGGAISGCALAVAETGTIILDCGPRQGRRALTLVPDYFLCVVLADQIVGTVPEAIELLGPRVAASRTPLTFISGPSATADIELERVVGVHGPRTLDVIVAGTDG